MPFLRDKYRIDREGGFMDQINDVSLSLLGYSRKQVNRLVEQKEARIKELEAKASEAQAKLALLEEKVSYFESIEQALKEGILDARVTGNSIVKEASEEAERLVSQTNEQVTQFKEEFAFTSRELVGSGSQLKEKMNQMKQEMLVMLAEHQAFVENTDFDKLYPENQVDRLVQQIDAYELDEAIDEIKSRDHRQFTREQFKRRRKKRT